MAKTGNGDHGVKSVSLEQKVTVALRKEILTGQFRRGERVTVEDLARRFGVSRTPVRDAVKSLENEGLVRVIPRKHVLIRGLRADEFNHINQIRSALEGLAAREAARIMSDDKIQACARTLSAAEAALDRDDLKEYGERHMAFHGFFIRGHQNGRLQVLLEDMYDTILAIRQVELQIAPHQQQTRFEHREILKALRERDATKVELLMRFHVDKELPFQMLFPADDEGSAGPQG